VWIEPVIAQEMMTLRAGTVFSSHDARSADAQKGGISEGEGRDAFMAK
jgi:hypothetical protein